MSGFLDGIGMVLGKVSEQFQSRVERLKNERLKLQQERQELEGKPCDEKISVRIVAIDKRLAELSGLLSNAAKD